MELDHVGGTFGGNRKPTPFKCLITKMLQIQPDKEIVFEFIKNEDYNKFCQSLQTLDFFGNSLSGPIPPQICDWLPYLVTLDLSNNDLTGMIPEDIAKCSYWNNLVLDNNKLSGNITYQFASLNRLKKFSVANNDLSGRVPSFSAAAGVELNLAETEVFMAGC